MLGTWDVLKKLLATALVTEVVIVTWACAASEIAPLHDFPSALAS